MDSDEYSSGMMEDDELDKLQLMAKYLRSKSLPLVYFPQHHANQQATNATNQGTKGLQAIRENSTESQDSARRDSEFNSSVKNEEGLGIPGVVNAPGFIGGVDSIVRQVGVKRRL